MTIKILNLYAGIGGNRKLWDGNIEVTAVERNKKIAQIYKQFFPDDEVIVGDAHQFLLKYFDSFDFIWSSPPCPSHSHIRKELGVQARGQNKPIYPDMKLYEEILLLKGYCKCKWVVENVISWYKPLIKPYEFRSHYFWANFVISGKKDSLRNHNETICNLEKRKGFDLTNFNNIDKRRILRNCVDPKTGLDVFNCAFKSIQTELLDILDEIKFMTK